MVKVTFEQDGRVEDVTSGEFVLGVIGSPEGQADIRVCILGQANDKDIAMALNGLIEKTVNKTMNPETRKMFHQNISRQSHVGRCGCKLFHGLTHQPGRHPQCK